MTSTDLAQRFHRHSRRENGDARDAWALARRLAGYLRQPGVRPNEEIAFSLVDGDRVGVSRFRRGVGASKYFAMISIERGDIPLGTWRRLLKLGTERFVHAGTGW